MDSLTLITFHYTQALMLKSTDVRHTGFSCNYGRENSTCPKNGQSQNACITTYRVSNRSLFFVTIHVCPKYIMEAGTETYLMILTKTRRSKSYSFENQHFA